MKTIVLAILVVALGAVVPHAAAQQVQAAVVGEDQLTDGTGWHYADHVWMSNPNGITTCTAIYLDQAVNIMGGLASPVVLQPGERIYIGQLEAADHHSAWSWHAQWTTYPNAGCSPK